MHQFGAILYVAWGALHPVTAYRVYQLGSRQAAGAVQGRLLRSAWNLAYFAIFVSVVAVVYNWQDIALGYWLHLVTASITDVGFIVTSLHLAMYHLDLASWVQPYG